MPEAKQPTPSVSKTSQTAQTASSKDTSGGTLEATKPSGTSSATSSGTSAAQRKQRSKVDPNESAAIKFKRLGRQRVTKALNAIKLVGNLASYPHDANDAAKIMGALSDATKEVEVRFKGKQDSSARKFDL